MNDSGAGGRGEEQVMAEAGAGWAPLPFSRLADQSRSPDSSAADLVSGGGEGCGGHLAGLAPMDGDRIQWHRPAAWVEFGIPTALLTGDALLALALDIVADTGNPAAVATFSQTLQDLLHGQSADMTFEQRGTVGADEYLEMAAGKTGALTSGACAIGAILAQATPEAVQALHGFGRRLGVAFQCIDDVLSIWGDPTRTGKPVGTDLQARKRTLPVLATLAAGGEPARKIRHLYAGAGRLGPVQMRELADAIGHAGRRAVAETEAQRQTELALNCLERKAITSPARTALGALSLQMTQRDR
ncbi:polyprenyl synthetase family protein [Streptomyces sp. CA-132043]|uniref:polyprenyl synthetase family protein n=1 Tax=Streptomyces sp. CA-132043 TaxID=3240048 RepID=UPI003D8B3045